MLFVKCPSCGHIIRTRTNLKVRHCAVCNKYVECIKLRLEEEKEGGENNELDRGSEA